ncbi:hypothetical protein Trydic_g18227 [Trypoxylus dichotomus]
MWSVRRAILCSFSAFYFLAVKAQRNNVCRNFEDYYKIDTSSNCYYDAAAEFEVIASKLESRLDNEARASECCAKKMRCCKKLSTPSSVEIRAVIVRCIDPPNVCMNTRHITKPLYHGNLHNLQKFKGFDEDEPLAQSEVTKCVKKLILTIKNRSSGRTNTKNQFIVIDHVYDPLSDQTVRLLNPYVIKMKQDQTSQSYGIHFRDFVNSQAREHVYNKHDGNYTGCCTDTKKSTCGVVTFHGKPLAYSTGFCCSCDAEKNVQRQPLSDSERDSIAYSDPAYLMDSVLCPRTKLDDARDEIKRLKEKEKNLTEKLEKLKDLHKEKTNAQKIQKDNRKRNMDNLNKHSDYASVYYIKPQTKSLFQNSKIHDDPLKDEHGKFSHDLEFSNPTSLNDDISTEMTMMIDYMNRLQQLDPHTKKTDPNAEGKVFLNDVLPEPTLSRKLGKLFNLVPGKSTESEKKANLDETNDKPSMHTVLNPGVLHSPNRINNFKGSIQKIADKAFREAFDTLIRRDEKVQQLDREEEPSLFEGLERGMPSNVQGKRQVQSSGIQRRGGQNCADRYTPPFVDPDTYHESAHCLKFSPVWYAVYKLSKPIVEQKIVIQVFQKFETPNGGSRWKDLTRGEKVRIGTFYPLYKDSGPTISMVFNSVYDDANFCLNWDKMLLLIPEGVKEDDLPKYPEVRGGPAEYLLVPKNKIHLTGDVCNVAGVGFEAFYKQPNRCSMPRGSCLHHQPFHLWSHDKTLERSGKKGCYFLKNYGILGKIPLKRNSSTGNKYLSLNYYGRYVSIIDMEIKADSNAVLRPTSSAVITEVYVDSTCATRTAITIKVSNAGLLSSRFMVRISDCPLEIENNLKDIKSDVVIIPPQNQHIFNLVIHMELRIDIFHCSVEVLNTIGELVALRRIKIQKLDRCICTWHCLCACIGSAKGLKCIPMSLDHYHAAGFKGGLPVISHVDHVTLASDVTNLIIFVTIFVIFLLFTLGLTKALLGLCSTRIGMWGMDVLLELPKPIHRYYDIDLQGRNVCHDGKGWPIHPDTGARMRSIPATTEFCVNIMFFFTYPTITFVMLLSRICCPFHRFRMRQRSSDFAQTSNTWQACSLKSCLHKKSARKNKKSITSFKDFPAEDGQDGQDDADYISKPKRSSKANQYKEPEEAQESKSSNDINESKEMLKSQKSQERNKSKFKKIKKSKSSAKEDKEASSENAKMEPSEHNIDPYYYTSTEDNTSLTDKSNNGSIDAINFLSTFAPFTKPQLVPAAGYPLETYKLTSSDGYILTVFRLPNVNYQHSNGYPVFVQHGILSTGANFVTLGNASLVYNLWDAGYDVWIGNFRGCYYSEGHVNLTVYDKEYWDHSIDEMATIDMPLIMEFIAKTTGRGGDIYYIGHSLGTTIGLMYAAEYPEKSAQLIRMFVFMAPAYTLSNMVSPYKKIIPLVPIIWKLANDFDLYRLLGQSQPAKAIAQIFCLESPILIQLCAQLHNLFYGPVTGVGSEKVPVYYNIVPGGTSLKVLAQAADLVANNFRKFNYGADNLKKYGSVLPPPYDVAQIKVPCYIIYGMNDWVAGGKDAINLYNTLSPEARSRFPNGKVSDIGTALPVVGVRSQVHDSEDSS